MKKKSEHHQQQAALKSPPKQGKIADISTQRYYAALLVIVLVSFVAYLPVLNNGFVNWDDGGYIFDNPSLPSINLEKIFSSYAMGNYHPLTVLIYSIEYKFFGVNPTGYHAVNLLLHLFNVVLVFYVIYFLSDKIEVALVASLLFGVHPIHVESVAWASELKDLLYTFFFLLAYLFYLKYLKDANRKFYFYCLLCFLLSLLSKAMAASFPLVLLLTIYSLPNPSKGRASRMSLNRVGGLIPFFALSIIFGVVAVYAQQSVGAIDHPQIFAFPKRIVFACYSFITYILKMILPVNLSAYYPYPIKGTTDIPLQYFIYPVLFLVSVAGVFYSRRYSNRIMFGMGFYAVTVFLVLQFLPVGDAVMADRYAYIPSIGIFYLAAEGFYYLWKKRSSKIVKTLAASFLIAAVVFFSAKTYARCGIWRSGMTLWNDVIKNSQTVPFAYYNRGLQLKNIERNEEAISDFTKAIELQPTFHEAYNNRGNLLLKKNKYDEALSDYNKTIELNPAYSEAYNNRGNLFMTLDRYEEALLDFNKVIQMQPANAEAYVNRGILLKNKKRYDEAINDYNKAIDIRPGYAEGYYNRANVFRILERNQEAYGDFSKAIALQPSLLKAYYNRGSLLMIEKRYEEAITDFSKAIELKADYAEAYFVKGMAEYHSGKKESACMDFKQAAALGFQLAADAMQQLCN